MTPAVHVKANVTEDGLVLLDVDKGRIFTANRLGARIWREMVVDKKRRAEVVAAIAEESTTPPDTVGADLDEFVERLREHQLVTEP